MSNPYEAIRDWNRKVFEEARRKREQEFDKLLREQQRGDEGCQAPSLF